MNNVNQDWTLGIKGLTGVISCLVGLAVIYFGYGMGTESPKKEAAAEVKPVAQRDLKKPVRAMNFALGHMVYFARDLGFSATTTNDSRFDTNKIAVRIENQLQGMREIYRSEVAKNPSLAGSMTLQLSVSSSGQVQQVREVSARINDGEFKKAVLAEAAKWSFADLTADPLNVICPLLFVHEGMDITSLVQWEKSMANLSDAPTPARLVGDTAPTRHANAAQTPAPTVASAKPAAAAMPKANVAAPGKSEGKEFRIKYVTLLRKEPNFSAPSLTTFAIGTKVTVLQKQGDWLQVRATADGPIGFIRKEFVVSLEVAQN
jgi:hypothetical protein